MKVSGEKCSCICAATRKPRHAVPAEDEVTTLAQLPVGMSATVVRLMPKMRGRKKFADVGLVAGTRLSVEAHAPFGGLLRVRVMESSMALHRDDAANVVMRREDAAK